jgi:hypothetical protein
MVSFFVQLRSGEDLRPSERRSRRLSREERTRRLDEVRRTVVACRKRIERILPPGAEIAALENVGGIIIGLSSGDDIPALQDRIREVCGDAVAGFSADADLELLQTARREVAS